MRAADPVSDPEVMREDVAAWSQWCLDRDTGVARAIREVQHAYGGAPEEVRWLISRLYRIVVRAEEQDFAETAPVPAEEVRPWMEVVVAAPEPAMFGPLSALLTKKVRREEFDRWRVLGAVGALACAAGLTEPEASRRWRVGTLDVPGLYLLAELRGYRFRPRNYLPAT